MKISKKEITNANAMDVLKEGLNAIAQSDFTVDLAGVERIDSSAIAVALKWQQEAEKHGDTIKFINVSDNLKKLSELYNVSSLLVPSSSQT